MNNILKLFKSLFASGLNRLTVNSRSRNLDVKSDSMKTDKRKSNDYAFEPFGHAHNKTEEFAWGAYVKFY